MEVLIVPVQRRPHPASVFLAVYPADVMQIAERVERLLRMRKEDRALSGTTHDIPSPLGGIALTAPRLAEALDREEEAFKDLELDARHLPLVQPLALEVGEGPLELAQRLKDAATHTDPVVPPSHHHVLWIQPQGGVLELKALTGELKSPLLLPVPKEVKP